MNFVEPIRERELVYDIGSYLKKKNERDYIMYMCGIYTGLRISDILKLKVRDVRNKKYIKLREKKTRKERTIEINDELKRALNTYIEGKDLDEYLVKSRENYNAPICRSMAYKILKAAGDRFGLESIGTHTLRKTFGYHFYKQTGDIVTLQQIFNHTHPSVTLKYIGINQESINKAMKKFKI